MGSAAAGSKDKQEPERGEIVRHLFEVYNKLVELCVFCPGIRETGWKPARGSISVRNRRRFVAERVGSKVRLGRPGR